MKKVKLIISLVSVLILVGCKKETIKLPNLEGKTLIEVKEVFNRDYKDIEILLKDNLTKEVITDEDVIFSHYGNGLNYNDEVKKDASIIIYFNIVKQKEILLPNLDNLTKEEIINKFNDLNINELNISLNFKYKYVDDSNNNTFYEYGNDLKVNDKISENNEIIVYLTRNTTVAPNLDGLTKEEIIAIFESIGSEELSLNIEIVNYYVDNLSLEEEGLFYKYVNIKENDEINSKETIKIYLKSSSINLPNLDGLKQNGIIEAFENLGVLSYTDVKIKFVDRFVENLPYEDEGTFHSYDNYDIDDLVIDGTITIYLKNYFVRLPNLNNKTVDQMIETLETLGVTSDYITFVPQDHLGVTPSTFIRYDGTYQAGKEYIPLKSNKIKIYYDSRKLLEDFSGLNKKEIIKELEKKSILNVEFEYAVDNTKEADTFKQYGAGLTIGDGIHTTDLLTIVLYENDNYDSYTLMLSKQLDGSKNDKALEIYNYGNEDVDLSGYYIAILKNGSLKPNYTIDLEGILKANETFLLVKENANEDLLLKADLIDANLDVGGNNVIQLRSKLNDTYFDTIYDLGNISVIFDNEIFVRRTKTFLGETLTGNRHFNTQEWMGYTPDSFSIFGTHPVDAEVGPKFELLDYIFAEYGMTKVKYLSAADGDTVYFDSLDPRDTNSYKGDERIRFLMVDAPETEKPGQVGMPYAQVATTFTRTLLGEASEIYLQADKSAGLVETYGRTLGLIWFKLDNDISFNNIAKTGNITITKGWHLLNYELLKYGLGESGIAKTGEYYNSPIFGNRYLYQWGQEAVWYAIANEYGLYSGVPRS